MNQSTYLESFLICHVFSSNQCEFLLIQMSSCTKMPTQYTGCQSTRITTENSSPRILGVANVKAAVCCVANFAARSRVSKNTIATLDIRSNYMSISLRRPPMEVSMRVHSSVCPECFDPICKKCNVLQFTVCLRHCD